MNDLYSTRRLLHVNISSPEHQFSAFTVLYCNCAQTQDVNVTGALPLRHLQGCSRASLVLPGLLTCLTCIFPFTSHASNRMVWLLWAGACRPAPIGSRADVRAALSSNGRLSGDGGDAFVGVSSWRRLLSLVHTGLLLLTAGDLSRARPRARPEAHIHTNTST